MGQFWADLTGLAPFDFVKEKSVHDIRRCRYTQTHTQLHTHVHTYMYVVFDNNVVETRLFHIEFAIDNNCTC